MEDIINQQKSNCKEKLGEDQMDSGSNDSACAKNLCFKSVNSR